MARNNESNVMIENAKLVWPNFSGEETQYNRKGDRNFCLILEPSLAEQMAADGWNVKTTKEREVDGETMGGDFYIQVTVGYKGRPPRIVMIGGTSGQRTELGEDLVALLDDVEMQNVDVIFRPYNWVMREGTPQEARGVKAYLQTLYVTIVENYLDLKYAQPQPGDTPDWAQD